MAHKEHKHCWIEYGDRPQEFVIHLLWAELEFDVKYAVIKRAKLSGIEQDKKLAKNYAFTASDEDWLLRDIDTAVMNAKAKLGWACPHAGRFSCDELLPTWKDYDIVLKFEGVKWLGSSHDLMNYIHTYVANYCIADFLEMSGNQDYVNIQKKADDALDAAYAEVNNVIVPTPIFRL